MTVSAATFERLALEADPEIWELNCGRPRRKPDAMTMYHNFSMRLLGKTLQDQLPIDRWLVSQNAGHLKRDETHYFVPDVAVIPRDYLERFRDSYELESYGEPLPLVVEVWSRSTGDYDVDEKFPVYMERGDLEIWRVHPYEQTLTAWRRQPDGSYRETTYGSGIVAVESLPGVAVDLDFIWF